MNIHFENIGLLAELQALDSRILKLEKELAACPVELEAVKKETEAGRKDLDEAGRKLKEAQVEKKNLENAILEAEEGIKKHQRELNAVKSNDAFKALLFEIENLKREKDESETKILEFLDAIDSLSAGEKAAAAAFKAVEAEGAEKAAEIEKKAETARAETAALRARREELAPKIEEDLLRKYDNIRKQKGGLALVDIKLDGKSYFCGGCNISLTPDQQLNAHKKDIMVVCENCGRLMRLKQQE